MHPRAYVVLALSTVAVTLLAVWVWTRADPDISTVIFAGHKDQNNRILEFGAAASVTTTTSTTSTISAATSTTTSTIVITRMSTSAAASGLNCAHIVCDEENPCCGASGWCGLTEAHCTGIGAIDPRPGAGKYWQEMAAYRAHQKSFGVADAICFAKAIADWDRPWLLLGGDSNWRKIFHRMIEQFVKAGVKGVERAALNPPKPGCDIRWFDDDAIFAGPQSNKTFRLSLRFVWGPDKLLSLRTSLRTVQQCCEAKDGSIHPSMACWEGQQPQLFGDAVWEVGPRSVVITHGFWQLPLLTKSSQAGEMCERVVTTGEGLRHILSANQSHRPEHLLWASTFHINNHPRMKNVDIENDRSCQRQVALQFGLQVLDVEALAPHRSVDVADYHLQDGAIDVVIVELMHTFAPQCR